MWEKVLAFLKMRYPREHQHLLRLWKASWRLSKPICVVAIAILAIPGLVIGYFVGRQTTTTNVYVPLQAVASQEAKSNAAVGEQFGSKPAPLGSVLVANRYYSPDNKNEISGRLDKISEAISRADREMLLPAQIALVQRFFARPADAGSYVIALDGIQTAAKNMDALLYDDLLAKERDYRDELNAILFPKDPLNNFTIAAGEYRNGIAVWIKLRDIVNEDDTNRELRQLVLATAKSFSVARDEYVKWLSRRQDLVAQTRRELRL